MKKLLLIFVLFCFCTTISSAQLRLTSPNGGEKFVIGSDTLITWEGVEKERRLRLEYSTDNGNSWFLISKKAFGYKYIWKNIPKPASTECLIRVSTHLFSCPDVKIGNQIWMGCNLDVDYYRNGDSIPDPGPHTSWDKLTIGVCTDYHLAFSDSTISSLITGKYYNFYAVTDPRCLAPLDYHIPSNKEWAELENYLGSSGAGGKLKSTGTIEGGDGLWDTPNEGATNETGFSALPYEYLQDGSGSDRLWGGFAAFWSTSPNYEDSCAKMLTFGSARIYWYFFYPSFGFNVRCIRDSDAPPDQHDTSDAAFSIVPSMVKTKDIDMKQSLIGFPKDSLIADFISNAGSYKFRVDSVYFTGADKDAFKLISDFPKYELAAGETKSTRIEFTPNRLGIHSAKINIITQSDTLINSIIGEGIDNSLEVISKLLDFGVVDVGSYKTIQDTALIKNTTSSAITINDVVVSGADRSLFDIQSGGGQFTLQPNEIRKLSLRFKPIKAVISSAQLNFEYDETSSPAIVQLLGTGAGALQVSIENDSAYAGEEKLLTLVFNNATPEVISSLATTFEAKIRFQKTILTTKNIALSKIVNDSIYVSMNGTIGISDKLLQIPVIAGLGNVEETTIDIVDFILKDDLGNIVDYDIETKSGLFKLLGICREGGTRLIIPSGKAEILSIIPNPASDDIEIKVNLIENGFTTLSVFNSNGVKLKEFNLNDGTGLKTINLNAKEFDNGLYFIELQTPTVVENKKLMIIK